MFRWLRTFTISGGHFYRRVQRVVKVCIAEIQAAIEQLALNMCCVEDVVIEASGPQGRADGFGLRAFLDVRKQ